MKTLNEAVKDVYAAVAVAKSVADETGQELILQFGDATVNYQPPTREGAWSSWSWYSSNC